MSLPAKHYLGRHRDCPPRLCSFAAKLCNQLDSDIRTSEATIEGIRRRVRGANDDRA